MLNNIKRLGLVLVIGSMMVGCSDVSSTTTEAVDQNREELNVEQDNVKKEEQVKEESKKEEEQVKEESKKEEQVKEEPKKENQTNDKYNKFRDLGRASINEDVVNNPTAYMDEDYFRECVYTIIYTYEYQFSARPYDGLNKEEGRHAMIEGAMEKLDVVLDDSVDELLNMVTIMIDNDFITIEEYNEFIKTPEEKQVDKDLVKEMCEQVKPMAIEEAQTYEPVEAWQKETMANIYKESGWIIDLFEYLVQNYPEATKEQRLEAVEYAKEVFVENFPTIEE